MKHVRHAVASAGLLSCFLLIHSNIAPAQSSSGLTLSNNQITFFNLPNGGTASQSITLNSTSSSGVVVNGSGAPSWLSVTPNGSMNILAGSPTTLLVTAKPTNLTPGTYDASFTVGVQGSTATPQTVVVTAFITGTSGL